MGDSILKYNRIFWATLFLLLSLLSCQNESSTLDENVPQFKEMFGNDTGIKNKNIVKESLENNSLNNNYLYSGGGVAVGDINNDGLQDIYFVNNEGNDGLYLNKGSFSFEKLPNKAVEYNTKGWSSGVSMVDINQDGWLDIYISRGGEHVKDLKLQKNLLFINNKDNTFTENAEKFGLADSGKTTQTVFFDYDLDGDLDAYVMNIPVVRVAKSELISKISLRTNPLKHPKGKESSDRLYKNNGSGQFIDVSKEAGILNWGFGLGIVISDINEDNWPDIYITNDFDIDNFLYINNQNGTFTESMNKHIKHCSYFAMGVDIADINNDALLDIYEVEMLPEKRLRSVVNMESMDRQTFETLVSQNTTPQYMRNSLNVNQGFAAFSEVAQFSGVSKTDWSWGVLIQDLDDDGLKDIMVTNGIAKDIKDRDKAREGNEISNSSSGQLSVEQHSALYKSTKIKNFVFHNEGDLKFSKVSKDWGFNYEGFSNGLAYGDLDNDGDLDIVVHNLNENPVLYKNASRQKGNNYLNIKFKGPAGNLNGIGAKVKILTEQGVQYQEFTPYRGFQSSSEHILHFGLGNQTSIKELEVTWPNQKVQKIKDINAVNKVLVLDNRNANENFIRKQYNPKYFAAANPQLGLDYVHKEIYYDDFKDQVLLPHKMSQLGPKISTTDLNKDGADDFFIGGAAGQSGTLYLSANGRFIKIENGPWAKDSEYEDIGSVFFDADQDNDLDLYVVSGSNEFKEGSKLYQDRLYLNQGNNTFKSATNMLPKIATSGSVVTAMDYDKDGDVDLFVGGRQVPSKYPRTPKSYLLINDKGIFKDRIKDLAPELEYIGMVTSAQWVDHDQDEDHDLWVTGEWMPIEVFENTNGKLKSASQSLGLANTKGWWFSLKEMDVDNDGDMDFVAGNIGLNHKFKTSKEKPFTVFCEDFDSTGTMDVVLAFHQDNKLYPVRGRDCSSEQMPFILDKFPSFESYGKADIFDVLGEKTLANSFKKEVQIFASSVLINNGNSFELIELPIEAQYSPIFGIESLDINMDGNLDLVLAGNLYQTEAETSRADANYGLLMTGDGKGKFSKISMSESGIFIPADTKDLKKLSLPNGQLILIAGNNDGPLNAFANK